MLCFLIKSFETTIKSAYWSLQRSRPCSWVGVGSRCWAFTPFPATGSSVPGSSETQSAARRGQSWHKCLLSGLPRPAPRPPCPADPPRPAPRPAPHPAPLCAPQTRPLELTRTFAGGPVSQQEQCVEVAGPSSGAVPLRGRGPVSGRGAWKQDFSLKAENAGVATREARLETATSCPMLRGSGVSPLGPQARPSPWVKPLPGCVGAGPGL